MATDTDKAVKVTVFHIQKRQWGTISSQVIRQMQILSMLRICRLYVLQAGTTSYLIKQQEYLKMVAHHAAQSAAQMAKV